MSHFNGLLNLIDSKPIEENDLKINETIPSIEKELNRSKPFDISLFAQELRDKSEFKNKLYHEVTNSISGYAISDCIAKVVRTILNYPVSNFQDKWLN